MVLYSNKIIKSPFLKDGSLMKSRTHQPIFVSLLQLLYWFAQDG